MQIARDVELNVWLDEDTSEAGPSIDEAPATLEVNGTSDAVELHVATSHGPLTTITLSLGVDQARELISGLRLAVKNR